MDSSQTLTITQTNQQDALSVCIYSTIFVQLYMFRIPFRSSSGVHDLLYSAAMYKSRKRV